MPLPLRIEHAHRNLTCGGNLPLSREVHGRPTTRGRQPGLARPRGGPTPGIPADADRRPQRLPVWLSASKLPDLLRFAPQRREGDAREDADQADLPTHIRTPDGEEMPV